MHRLLPEAGAFSSRNLRFVPMKRIFKPVHFRSKATQGRERLIVRDAYCVANSLFRILTRTDSHGKKL